MRTSERICRATALAFAVVMSVFGAAATAGKINNITSQPKNVTAAAGLTMQKTSGNTDFDRIGSDTDIDTNPDTDTDAESESDTDHTGENTYLVTECLYRESNMSYDNFYVKNATDLAVDLRGCLAAKLPYEYEDTNQPQVLIVHTHATESYMDSDLGYYYESFEPRSDDDDKNVVKVGDAICKSLEKNGVAAVHCTAHHDEPSYLGAYDNSADSMREYLARYPSIKIMLDIHRDSITTDENEKIKPTFTYGGKKAAQIMIMCGNDNYGYYDFPDWHDNLALAVKLQSTAETMYPGMTRPLYFGNFMYNMNIAPGSLLIEVGTDANTLDEAARTGDMLGAVVARVLKQTASE